MADDIMIDTSTYGRANSPQHRHAPKSGGHAVGDAADRLRGHLAAAPKLQRHLICSRSASLL
jgi:hypothetical protein